MHTYIYIFMYTIIYIYIDTSTGAGFRVNNRVNILPEFCLHSHNCLKINMFDVNKTINGKNSVSLRHGGKETDIS